MISLKIDDIVKKSPKITWRRVENEGVLLNLNNGDYFTLSEVGVEIWKRLDGDTPISEIVSFIAEKYRISNNQALRDARGFMKILFRYELVEV